MNDLKTIWDTLAKKNSRYYINTDKGQDITEKQFRESGRDDVVNHILDDELFNDRFFKNGTILEIGCGTGRMTEFMAREFKTVIGIDISGEMIRQAKDRLKDSTNVELMETNGSSIPLPDNSVDYAFSYLVFQHIKTRNMVEKNFGEVSRVLKPGRMFKVLLRTDEQKDVTPWWSGVHYDEELLRELCQRMGFSVVKLKYVRFFAMWVWVQKYYE